MSIDKTQYDSRNQQIDLKIDLHIYKSWLCNTIYILHDFALPQIYYIQMRNTMTVVKCTI